MSLSVSERVLPCKDEDTNTILPELDFLGVYTPFWSGLLDEKKVVLFLEGDPTDFDPCDVRICVASPGLSTEQKCPAMQLNLTISVVDTNTVSSFDHISSRLEAKLVVLDSCSADPRRE